MERVKQLLEKAGKIKKEQLIVFILAGVLLFVISIPVEKKEKEEQGTKINLSVSENSDIGADAASAYARELEEKLASTLSAVQGVGYVKVMITLASTAETVVEKDIPNTRNTASETDSAGGTRTSLDISSTESTVYVTDKTGIQSPYVVMKKEPVIKGIVIVAQGGGDPVTVAQITEAAQALFQVDAHKIKVMKMRKNE